MNKHYLKLAAVLVGIIPALTTMPAHSRSDGELVQAVSDSVVQKNSEQKSAGGSAKFVSTYYHGVAANNDMIASKFKISKEMKK